jgi:hypothetical protein
MPTEPSFYMHYRKGSEDPNIGKLRQKKLKQMSKNKGYRSLAELVREMADKYQVE